MGQYKVPQDVETEDKILGPLSIKQFIYVIIALLWAFLMWRIFSFSILIAIVFAFPVTGFFLMLGFGQREGVPFEDFVVAFIRFLIVPRKRMWIKDDSKEVVVQDAPKKDPTHVSSTKNVTPGQLKQLASIIDTRGNFKDPSISLPDENNQADVYASRIIGPAQVGAATPASGAGVVSPQATTPKDDVLDETSVHATQVNQMLQNAEEAARNSAVAQMQKVIANPQSQAQQQPQVPQPNPAANQIVRQTEGLTVQRVAAHANQQLNAGQQVQLRKSN